jgi:hypothetical protein
MGEEMSHGGVVQDSDGSQWVHDAVNGCFVCVDSLCKTDGLPYAHIGETRSHIIVGDGEQMQARLSEPVSSSQVTPTATKLFEPDDERDDMYFQADTGGVRSVSEGRGRYDLVSPIAMERLAKRLEWGATKYGDRNWEKGLPLRRYAESVARHFYQHMHGDRAEDHLAAVMFNVMAWIHTEEEVAAGRLPNTLVEGMPAVRN